MDTVLVTGGTGHLGRDLVGVLKDGYRVRADTPVNRATSVPTGRAVRGARVACDLAGRIAGLPAHPEAGWPIAAWEPSWEPEPPNETGPLGRFRTGTGRPTSNRGHQRLARTRLGDRPTRRLAFESRRAHDI